MSTRPAVEVVSWFQGRALAWFAKNGRAFPWRRKSASTYQKIVAEVLLQRTRADVAAAFIPGFTRTYPSWRSLGEAKRAHLEQALKPIGLWRRRTEALTRLGREMVRRRGRFPGQRNKLEMLPGVGQYIANAVFLFYHHEAQPLLDSNMARVLERFFGPRQLADIRYDPYLQALALAVTSHKTPVEMNWAILDLAALVCRLKSPSCERCPLALKCRYRADRTTDPASASGVPADRGVLPGVNRAFNRIAPDSP